MKWIAKLGFFSVILLTLVSEGYAARAPSRFRFKFETGLDQFGYNEDHPLQPSLNAENFSQLGVHIQAQARYWIVPRGLELMGLADSTVAALRISDGGNSVSLVNLRGGLNAVLGSFESFELGSGFGLSGLSMVTTGRPWGFQYLKGPFFQLEFDFALSGGNSVQRLTFIPRLTLLSENMMGPFNLNKRELSFGVEYKIPLGKTVFPAFANEKDLLMSIYYDRLNYVFDLMRPITLSYDKFRFSIGYEF